MLRVWLTVIAGVLAIGLALFAGWWLYDLGKVNGVVELKSLRTEYAVLEKKNENLLDGNRSLSGRVAVLERSAEIDRQATEDVKNDLARLEEELQAAREEVEFYRGIVSPGDVQSDLRIHRFKLKEDALPGRYVYDLVLTQLKRNMEPVSGTVDWRISGFMLGEPGELALAGVTHPCCAAAQFPVSLFSGVDGCD